MKNFPRSRPAFTLIELLTVIAIIAILAAILIPVVGSVRDSARSARCVSNLRSTATGMLNYINDSDGVLMTFRGGTQTHLIWPNVLRDEGYFSFRTNQTSDESYVCPSWEFRAHHFDAYGLNVFDPEATFFNPGNPNANMYRRNFNDAHITPSRYILLADSLRGPGGRQVFRLIANVAHADGAIHTRHNGRANVAFLDGHVASHGPDTLGKLEPVVRSGYDLDGNVIDFPQD